MELTTYEKDSIFVVKPKEKRIDSNSAPGFKKEMIKFIEEGKKNIVLNLSDVDFIDSSGLGVIVSILKRVRKEGDIKLCCAKESVKSVFELTKLDKVFEFFYSEEEAVDSF
ncbi:MAG: STAS domain-containing protein [Deltaproteobacteria bacterium]|nr:STAS domain-containing protein [Deltaproteobacteria bacterium]